MATGRQVTYTLRLNSNASAILNQAERDANQFDNSMWKLQKTLAAFGVGLGANFLSNQFKSFIDGAKEFELSVIRIKNASASQLDGLRNSLFIEDITTKFKLNLQDTYDSYSKFLFKVKNSDLSSGLKNTIFKEFTAIGKIGGLSNQQLEATINQMSILLGEGVLESRHLRPLSQQHPQIIPYIADVIGLKSGEKDLFTKLVHSDDAKAIQKLSQMMSSTKLTKMGLSSTDILPLALEKYYNDLVKGKGGADKLAESLGSLQSNINSLGTQWDRFKNKFVLDDKGSVNKLIGSTVKAIDYLSDHSGSINNIVKKTVEFAVALGAVKLALLGLKLPMMGLSSFGSFMANTSNAAASYAYATNRLLISNHAPTAFFNQNLQNGVNIKDISQSRRAMALSLSGISNTEDNIKYQNSNFSNLKNQSSEDLLNKLKNNPSYYGYSNSQLRNTQEFVNQRKYVNQLGLLQNQQIRNLKTYNRDFQTSFAKFTNSLSKNSLNSVSVQNINNEVGKLSGTFQKMNTQFANATGKVSGALMGFVGALGLAQMGLMFLTPGKITGRSVSLKDYAKDMTFQDDVGRQIDRENEEWERIRVRIAGKSVPNKMNELGTELWSQVKNSPYIDDISRKDSYGARDTTNIGLYELLRNKGLIPKDKSIIPPPDEAAKPYDPKDPKNHPEEKESHKIRGNSSNYFTVHIDEMNGVKTYTVENKGGGNSMNDKKVAEIAGSTFIKMLTDALSDSQLLKN